MTLFLSPTEIRQHSLMVALSRAVARKYFPGVSHLQPEQQKKIAHILVQWKVSLWRSSIPKVIPAVPAGEKLLEWDYQQPYFQDSVLAGGLWFLLQTLASQSANPANSTVQISTFSLAKLLGIESANLVLVSLNFLVSARCIRRMKGTADGTLLLKINDWNPLSGDRLQDAQSSLKPYQHAKLLLVKDWSLSSSFKAALQQAAQSDLALEHLATVFSQQQWHQSYKHTNEVWDAKFQRYIERVQQLGIGFSEYWPRLWKIKRKVLASCSNAEKKLLFWGALLEGTQVLTSNWHTSMVLADKLELQLRSSHGPGAAIHTLIGHADKGLNADAWTAVRCLSLSFAQRHGITAEFILNRTQTWRGQRLLELQCPKTLPEYFQQLLCEWKERSFPKGSRLTSMHQLLDQSLQVSNA